MNVTRDVVSDLWPLYVSGEASADTCRLVDAFLAADPEFARQLETSRDVDLPSPAPTPDHEMQTLRRVKRGLDGDHWLFKFACLFTVLAVVRLVMDTTFVAPPSGVMVAAVLAAVCWTAFGISLYRARRRFLLVRLR